MYEGKTPDRSCPPCLGLGGPQDVRPLPWNNLAAAMATPISTLAATQNWCVGGPV